MKSFFSKNVALAVLTLMVFGVCSYADTYDVNDWGDFSIAYHSDDNSHKRDIINLLGDIDGWDNDLGARTNDNYTQINTNYLTINGNGHTLDAAPKGGFQTFNNTLNFTNITFFGFQRTETEDGSVILFTNEQPGIVNFVGSAPINFYENVAAGNGGAIYITNTNSILNLANSQITFSGNSSEGDSTTKSGGGAIYSTNFANIYIDNATLNFLENKSALHGGAIFAGLNTKTIFRNSEIHFSGNIADDTNGFGGAIISTDNSKVEFQNARVKFEDNSAGYGGGIYLNNSTITFNSPSIDFLGNQSLDAAGSGGGIFVNFASLTLDASIVNFSENESAFDGGALSVLEGTKVDVKSPIINFENNVADNFGGAISIIGGSKITFNAQKVNLIGNTADEGGAIYATDSDTKVSFENIDTLTVKYNESINGFGVMYWTDGASVTFKNVKNLIAKYNTAKAGTLIYFDKEDFVFNGNVEISSNLAQIGEGGGLALENSKIVFSGQTIDFTSNTAATAGGAMAIWGNSTVTFNGVNTEFKWNHAGLSGGAFHIAQNSNVTFIDASFKNNIVDGGGGVGGAISIFGLANNISTLTIRAVNKDVIFSGNVADNGDDINIEDFVELEFNAASRKVIDLQGGLVGGGTSVTNLIRKTGSGNLTIESIDFVGKFRIEEGAARVGDGANIGTLEIVKNARFGYKPSQTMNTTAVEDLTVNGILEVNIYVDDTDPTAVTATADLIGVTGAVDIGVDSFLDIGIMTQPTFYGQEYKDIAVHIIDYSSIIGGFKSTNGLFQFGIVRVSYVVDYGSLAGNEVNLVMNISSNFDYINLTQNQKEVAKLLAGAKANSPDNMRFMLDQFLQMRDELSVKTALNDLSGGFLANSLIIGATNHNTAAIHNRIDLTPLTIDEKFSPIWIQGGISGLTLSKKDNLSDDFVSSEYEFQAGADLIKTEDSILGVYVSYGLVSLEQDKNKANVTDIQMGLYGGLFWSHFSVLGTVSGGVQTFDTTRNIAFVQETPKAEFATKSIRLTSDVEYKIEASQNLMFKPFVGLEAGAVFNNEIEEKLNDYSTLIIDPSVYMRLTGLFGIKAEMVVDRLIYHGKVYGGYILVGNEPKYDMYFKDGKEYGTMSIRGAKEDSMSVGVGVGAEYAITPKISLYANADINKASEKLDYYANIGANFKLIKHTIKPLSPEKVEARRLALEKRNNAKLAAEEKKAKNRADAEAARLAKTQKEGDKQEKEIETKKVREKMQEYYVTNPSQLERARREKVAGVPQRFIFPTTIFIAGDFELSDSSRNIVVKFAETLKTYTFDEIKIEVYVSSQKNEKENKFLATMRASSMYMQILKDRVPYKKISYEGHVLDDLNAVEIIIK